jgi:hypothetical protein
MASRTDRLKYSRDLLQRNPPDHGDAHGDEQKRDEAVQPELRHQEEQGQDADPYDDQRQASSPLNWGITSMYLNDAYIQKQHLRMETEAKDAGMLRSMGVRQESEVIRKPAAPAGTR